MLSLSVDFYVRVFVRIYTSPAAVKDSGSKLMYVYQSQGCDSFYTQKVGRTVRKNTCHLCSFNKHQSIQQRSFLDPCEALLQELLNSEAADVLSGLGFLHRVGVLRGRGGVSCMGCDPAWGVSHEIGM